MSPLGFQFGPFVGSRGPRGLPRAASEPISVGAQGARAAAAPGTYDYFGGTDYDYEPFGAVSGTYAVAVSLIFLEEISLNGGSITII